MPCRPAAAGMPQDGKDEIEMVGVQAGHETAHICSADISGPAGSPRAGIGASMSITSGTKSRAWSTPKAKCCPGDLAPARSVAAQARSAACRSRRTTPARASGVSTSIACLSNRTSSESLSQKQPQAAQSAHTCGKPPSFGIPTPACRAGGRPNSDPSRGGGGRGIQNRARYGVLPTAAQASR
jgi:hypothetical protein